MSGTDAEESLAQQELYFSNHQTTRSIHGTNGIFTYMKTININQHVGKYSSPMDGMGKQI